MPTGEWVYDRNGEDEQYTMHPESAERIAGAPTGTCVPHLAWGDSRIYPGTTRDWVVVAGETACLEGETWPRAGARAGAAVPATAGAAAAARPSRNH